MVFKNILIAFVFSVTVLSSSLIGAGILWDENDLQMWRDRAVNGPYKSAGDAFDPLIPGEWQRITDNANQFRSNPTADRKSSYTVYTHRNDAKVVKNHVKMVDAAFYALVQNDQQLAAIVKNELVWHSQQQGLQIARNVVQVTDHGNWFRTEWLERLLMCADFVEEAFSSSELSTFKAWIADWAHSYEYSIDLELSVNHFGNRQQRDYENNLGYNATNPYYIGKYAYRDASGVRHHQIAQMHQKYNNRKAIVVEFFGLAGVWLSDPLLKDRGKLFVEEWLQFGVFPDGSQGEFERNKDSNIQQGLAYMTTNIGAAALIASSLEKNGDPSLFNYSTRNGIWGTECEAGDPDKTLKLTVDTYFDMIEHQKKWYYAEGPIEDDYIIDNTVSIGTYAGKQWLGELYFAPVANRYWQDERIRKGYMRQNVGSPSYPSSITSVGASGPYGTYWRGFKASIPSILFMFAEIESGPSGGNGAPVVIPDFDLMSSVAYNSGDFTQLNNSVLTEPVYVSVQPADSIQSVSFYNNFGSGDVFVNTESNGPYDYIMGQVSLKPEDIVGAELTVVAIITAIDGSMHRVEALVSSADSPVTTPPGGGGVYPEGYREATVGGQLVFGLDPAWKSGSEFEKAFDGDTSTFYDYINGAGAFIGIDIGESTVVQAIRYQPRSSWANRMVGGIFEGSNESSVSGYETIHVILETPLESEQIIPFDSGKSYRYYRYVSPSNGFGNIAEFSLDLLVTESEKIVDRLPDDWEREFFGGVDVEHGGEDEDFDGDGRSNYEEWLAGTAPSDASDFLELTPILGVAWMSASDRSYEIEYSDDNWHTLEVSSLLAGTGEQMFWIDPSAGNVIHRRQYRVLVIEQ